MSSFPAYRAAKTLERTVREIPADVVDKVILVDDASSDETVELSSRLGLRTFAHEINRARSQKAVDPDTSGSPKKPVLPRNLIVLLCTLDVNLNHDLLDTACLF